MNGAVAPSAKSFATAATQGDGESGFPGDAQDMRGVHFAGSGAGEPGEGIREKGVPAAGSSLVESFSRKRSVPNGYAPGGTAKAEMGRRRIPHARALGRT